MYVSLVRYSAAKSLLLCVHYRNTLGRRHVAGSRSMRRTSLLVSVVFCPVESAWYEDDNVHFAAQRAL